MTKYQSILAGREASAIAFDASSTVGTTANPTYSFPHTVAASNNTVLLYGHGCRSAQQNACQVHSVTYNGTNLTSLRRDEAADTGPAWVDSEIWYLANPSTGENTVAVTIVGTAAAGNADSVVSFTGVDQSTPFEANNGAVGTSTTPSVSVTTVTNNAWVFSSLFYRSGSGRPNRLLSVDRFLDSRCQSGLSSARWRRIFKKWVSRRASPLRPIEFFITS